MRVRLHCCATCASQHAIFMSLSVNSGINQLYTRKSGRHLILDILAKRMNLTVSSM